MAYHIDHCHTDIDTFNSSSVPDGTQTGMVRIAVVTDQMSPRDISYRSITNEQKRDAASHPVKAQIMICFMLLAQRDKSAGGTADMITPHFNVGI